MIDPSASSLPALDIFDAPAATVARRLIGATLLCEGVGGAIVETEAYERDDPASHSYRGPTPGNADMFGPPGTVYVYRSYGIHWCFNIVCRPGSAVLVRALEPYQGVELMAARRNVTLARGLCSGPGKLCQALAITGAHSGLSVADAPFALALPAATEDIVTGPRIGITKAAETPWRFGRRNSPYLSRRFPRPDGG